MGVEEEGQIQWQQHHQLLGEVVGVVKDGIDSAGHTGVDGHILLRGHHLHADISLVAAVNGGDRDTQHRQSHHQLKLLIFPHGAYHQQHQQEGGNVEGKEAHGQAGRDGPGQGNADKGHIEAHVGPQGVQLQPILGPGSAADDEQAGDRNRAQQAIGVVPHLMGGHQHHQHEQAQEEESGPANGAQEAAEQAAVPYRAADLVEPLTDGTGDVDDSGEQPVNQAVRPGLWDDSLPPDKAEENAPPQLPGEPPLQARAGPSGQTARPGLPESQPEGQEKAKKQAVFCDRHQVFTPWNQS